MITLTMLLYIGTGIGLSSLVSYISAEHYFTAGDHKALTFVLPVGVVTGTLHKLLAGLLVSRFSFGGFDSFAASLIVVFLLCLAAVMWWTSGIEKREANAEQKERQKHAIGFKR